MALYRWSRRIFRERDRQYQLTRLRAHRGSDVAGEDAFFRDHPDAMLIADLTDHRVLAANPAAETVYGWNERELCEMRLGDLEVPEPGSAPVSGDQAITSVRTHRRKDQTLFKVRMRQRPLQHAGRPALLIVLEDLHALFTSLQAGESPLAALNRAQEQEANLKVAQQLLKIGFWKYDISDRKLIWSPSVYEMAGINPEDFDGSLEEYVEILFSDDREQAALSVQMLDDPDVKFHEFERRITRKDGSTIHVKGIGARTQTVSGDVVTGVVQDVTAERNRQSDLRLLGASVERLNDIVVILRVDPAAPGTEAPVVYINAAFERITGYSRSQVLRRPLSFILSRAEPKIDPRALEAAMNAGRSLRVEVAGPINPGRQVTWDVEFLPVSDAYGKYSHWVAVARDITDRRAAERRAAINEDRFQFVSRSTADVVWEWDITSSAFIWSEAFDKVAGAPGAHQETGFGSWSRRIHPEDRDRVVASLMEAVASPDAGSWSEEYRFIGDDGRERIILDRGFIVRDEAGTAARMVGTMIDLTERRASEQRSRDSERLEAIGQLTGGVAHDFNNLLTVILGNSDVLRDRLEDPAQRRMADLIHLAATRGSDLTRRLLAFARRQPLKPQRTCLNERTGSVHALLRGALDARIRIRHSPAPGLWEVQVDPGQFDVALLNLAFNARDAMPSGGTLTISTENVKVRGRSGVAREGVPAGDYVCITVSDTGAGMEVEAQRRAFEPFFTTKPPGKGSGLGLSMVYGFARQSDGHILIRSAVGEGTSVRLFFPRAPKSGVETSASLPDVDEPALLGPGSVLIVEDDPLVREHSAHNFHALGYKVSLAASAEEALGALEADPAIFMLFTDVVLGAGMNGLELAVEARRRQPGLKVLYTSGYVPGEIGFNGSLVSDAEFLRKPYERHELIRKLADLQRGSVPGG